MLSVKFFWQRIKNNIGLLLGTIHVLISIYADHYIFIPDNLLRNNIYLCIKLFAIISIYAFWIIMIGAIKHTLSNTDVFCKIFVRHFLIYFAIMIAFLILTWPGVWRSDDAYILATDVNLVFNTWHHWLTDAFYIYSLCIIGFPTGIIIVQLIIISIIFSYIVTKIYILYNSKIGVFSIYIIYLLPSIIDNNLFPLRSSLITHIEIFFIMTLLIRRNEHKVNIKDYCLWALLIAILATWRSEGIYYILIGPIAIILLLRNELKVKFFSIMVGISLLLTMGINYEQGKSQDSDVYGLSMVIGHLQTLVEKSEISEEEQKIINDVFLDEYGVGTDYQLGFSIVVGDRDRRYNEADFSNKVKQLQKLYFKLIIRNKKVFLEDCWKLFKQTSLQTHNVGCLIAQSPDAFEDNYIYGTIKNNPYGNYLFITPISKNIRKIVISVLECRKLDNYSEGTVGLLVLYNVLPSFFLLLLLVAIGILKKRIEILVSSLIVIPRYLIVFMAAPSWYIMYYFPGMLSAYVLVWYYMIQKYGKSGILNADVSKNV